MNVNSCLVICIETALLNSTLQQKLALRRKTQKESKGGSAKSRAEYQPTLLQTGTSIKAD